MWVEGYYLAGDRLNRVKIVAAHIVALQQFDKAQDNSLAQNGWTIVWTHNGMSFYMPIKLDQAIAAVEAATANLRSR